MSGVKKINKKDIIDVALNIARQDGLENVQARTIAKKLNCSTQPIFYQFANMEELKKQLIQKILEVYRKYMQIDEKSPFPYRQIGEGYIKFAKEESMLFRIIFMSPNNLTTDNYITHDKMVYEEIQKYVSEVTGITSKEKIKDFHLKMWIFTHGIATMLATKTCEISDEKVSEMLNQEFKALMLLERGNK